MGSTSSTPASCSPSVDSARSDSVVREAPPLLQSFPRARSHRDGGVFRVALLGDAGCGKTSLVRAFCEDERARDADAAGATGDEKKGATDEGKGEAWPAAARESSHGTPAQHEYMGLSEQGPRFRMEIIDAPGGEDVRITVKHLCRGSDAYLLCIDLTAPGDPIDSIDRNWIQFVGGSPFFLVGCKADRPNARLGLGQGYADACGIPYIETSALTGENVNEVFFIALRDCKEKERRLPCDGCRAADYFRAFAEPDLQAFLRSVGFSQPEAGIQRLIAEFAAPGCFHFAKPISPAEARRRNGDGTAPLALFGAGAVGVVPAPKRSGVASLFAPSVAALCKLPLSSPWVVRNDLERKPWSLHAGREVAR